VAVGPNTPASPLEAPTPREGAPKAAAAAATATLAAPATATLAAPAAATLAAPAVAALPNGSFGPRLLPGGGLKIGAGLRVMNMTVLLAQLQVPHLPPPPPIRGPRRPSRGGRGRREPHR